MRRGGIFNKNFAANLLENQRVKKFWKSAETNYRCEFGPRCIYGILSQVTSGKSDQVGGCENFVGEWEELVFNVLSYL